MGNLTPKEQKRVDELNKDIGEMIDEMPVDDDGWLVEYLEAGVRMSPVRLKDQLRITRLVIPDEPAGN